MVPIKGTYEIYEDGTFAGNMTHLGRFTGTLGVNEYVAANGDVLTYTITSENFQEVAFPIFKYTNEHQITGGTGRFKNATGSLTTKGTLNVWTLAGGGVNDGMISRPNSGK